MNTLLQRLRNLFAGQSGNSYGRDGDPVLPVVVDTAASLDIDSLAHLMQLVEHTKEGEYSCQETLDLLDEYVELIVNDQDAEALMPLLKGHLERCIDCRNRYDVLVRILQTT